MLCFLLGMMVGGTFGVLVLLFFMGANGLKIRGIRPRKENED